MKPPYGSHRLLLASALASAGAHAIVALFMSGMRLGSPSDSLVHVTLLDPESIEDLAVDTEIVLGVEDSELEPTPDWLGFPDPTPHQAPLSETAQSQLTPEPMPASEGEREIVAAAEVMAEQPASPEPPPVAPTAPAPIELDELSESLARTIEAAREAGWTMADLAARSVRFAAREAAEAPARSGETGERSDREADATAREEPIEVRPGRVASGPGLEITTRRPRWRALTTMTTSPVNPVVRIEFGRDGRVLKAEFVDGRGTGFPDVDGPLLNAIITRWTAKGRAIDELSEAPDASVSITMKIILSGPSV